jgi:hypothetical protein
MGVGVRQHVLDRVTGIHWGHEVEVRLGQVAAGTGGVDATVSIRIWHSCMQRLSSLGSASEHTVCAVADGTLSLIAATLQALGGGSGDTFQSIEHERPIVFTIFGSVFTIFGIVFTICGGGAEEDLQGPYTPGKRLRVGGQAARTVRRTIRRP